MLLFLNLWGMFLKILSQLVFLSIQKTVVAKVISELKSVSDLTYGFPDIINAP